MVKKLLSFLLCMAIAVSLAACSSGDSESGMDSSSEPTEDEPLKSGPPVAGSIENEQPEITDISNKDPVKPGRYTLPCGATLFFYDSVENDVTGKWRHADTSDSFVPADYAVEYYNMLFSSDDEVHSIWNAELGTTTSISCSGDQLFVDTYKYVDGEEHDAGIMFSGEHLDSRIIDKETGEPFADPEAEDPEESGDDADSESVTAEPAAIGPGVPEVVSVSQPAEDSSQNNSSNPSNWTAVQMEPVTGSLKTPDYSGMADYLRELAARQQEKSDTSAFPSTSRVIVDRHNWPSGMVLATAEKDDVYHTRNCQAAETILPENEIWYNNADAAKKDGRRLCDFCGR